MTTTDEYDPNDFERPSVTVDVVVLAIEEHQLVALVHERPAAPFVGRLALPGGFIGMGESLDAAAARVLATKGGVEDVWLEQLYTFGAVGRDPRTRVLSVAYMALVDVERLRAGVGSAPGAAFVGIDESDDGWRVRHRGADVDLAFDHAAILETAVTRLRGKLDWAPVGFQLLPDVFTLRELQQVHEVVGGAAVNTQSFRRRMLASGDLIDTGELEQDVSHRPGSLYRFARATA